MKNCHYLLLSEAGEELLRQKAREQKSPDSVWDHYPRPQMRRESFYSLNGIWEAGGQKIQVPFPPQSLLSGYKGHVGAHLEYSRTFRAPLNPSETNSRLLLHFGAVDQVAEVFLNHRFLGKHEGGYLPFSFDITEFVTEGDNLLTVKVTDTLSPRYPYGKQRKARGGMWYTPVSGIWQSVWMECVPQLYIKNLAINADTEKISLHVTDSGTDIPQNRNGSENASVEPKGEKEVPNDSLSVTITLHDGSQYTVCEDNQAAAKQNHDTPHAEGHTIEIDLTSIRLEDGSLYQPVLWTPEHPYLYEMTVTLGSDTVSSYFGLRKIEVKQINGIPRVCLNGAPIFLHGVLDQGYFCDGIYLPATEEEYEQDILRMKNLGINMLRKHIKIEPECFYHYCDTHGMLVMQDMVNSGVYSWIKDTALPTLGIYQKRDGRIWSHKKRRNFFTQHMEDTIRHLRSHPCVIAYTIFNEGWGQFDSDAMYIRARQLDSSRLYDTTSGWFPRNESDFDSQHIYFKKLLLPELPQKPVLVSECGGYSLRIPEHFFSKYAKYGYGKCANEQELTERILHLYEDIILPAIPKGLCGCIYTQLSDVEDETNGLYTYDRRCLKVDPKAMRELADRLMAASSEIPL